MSYSEEITKRFVKAYYALYGLQKVKSKKKFCDAIGSRSTHFILMEKGERRATVENIALLVEKFDVSPEWLLTGKGNLY